MHLPARVENLFVVEEHPACAGKGREQQLDLVHELVDHHVPNETLLGTN